MENIFIELSKYIILIFMAIYTLECFTVFKYNSEEARGGIYIRQNLWMFLIHFIAFVVLCLEADNMALLVFYMLQQITLFGTIAAYRIVYPKSNRLIVNNMCMLLTIGFIILTRLSFDRSVKQFKIVVISIAGTFIIPYLMKRMRGLRHFTWAYGGVGLAALLLVTVAGSTVNGSKLSFSLLGFSFQPSEFVKLLYVFCIAGMLQKARGFFQVALTALVAGAHVLILVLSRDLGSALIFFVVYIMMVYVATGRFFYLLAGALGGSIASVVAYRLFSHVRVRVTAWQDPFSVIEAAGYQMAQSLFAIGTGGWFGMGLSQGAPRKIPIVEADFVFSAISEELGGIFGLCLILVCASCFVMFMNIAMRLKDDFYKLVATGLGVTYGFQVFMTIGGVTKFIPLTGVTLPLVSYGGSSVLSTLMLFSVIQGMYIVSEGEKREKGKEEIRERNREAGKERRKKAEGTQRRAVKRK